jgi:uncharacterized repeat protein (TIGR04138 family)
MEHGIEDRIEAIVEKDSRYRAEAYAFVLAALNYTLSRFEAERHATAAELLEGIREFGLSQYGPMTKTVFNHWGIESSSQFGDIVFNLIDAEVLGKRDEDRREDFDRAAFDLGELTE